MANFKRVLIILLGIIVAGFLCLVIGRVIYFFYLDKVNAEVARIHAIRLTMDDVLGKNMPPDPGVEADKTVAGVDVNHNGIRDDVELAIFKAYPDSAKTRAVLLQYALALQMEATEKMVNRETVTAVAEMESRANGCLADTLVPRKSPESSRNDIEMESILKYAKSIESIQYNTTIRTNSRKGFFEGRLGSYTVPPYEYECDLDM